jgi:hypothetical protein
MPKPSVEKQRDWARRLLNLQGGEGKVGVYDDKLETLVRFAWEEAAKRVKEADHA